MKKVFTVALTIVGAFGSSLLLAMPAQKGATAAAPVSVYVFTAPLNEGFVDEDSQRRADSVKDLRENLAKKKGLFVVDNAELADITLEVVGSAKTESGETGSTVSKGIFGTVMVDTKSKPLPELATLLRVPGTEYSTKVSVQGNFFWKFLAKLVSDKVEKWTKDNRGQLQRQ